MDICDGVGDVDIEEAALAENTSMATGASNTSGTNETGTGNMTTGTNSTS